MKEDQQSLKSQARGTAGTSTIDTDHLYQLLKEDSRYWQLIIESLKDYALFVVNAQGYIMSWNSGGEQVFGYRPEEVIGKSCSFLFTPEDQANNVPALEMKTALEKQRAIDERYHVRKDGSFFWASGQVFPLYDPEGAHIGFTKIMRNMDDLKQAENQFMAIKEYATSVIQTSAIPMVVVDSDYRINSVNASFLKSFESLGPVAEGESFFEACWGQWDRPELRRLLEAASAQEAAVETGELVVDFDKQGRRILSFTVRRLLPLKNNSCLLLLSIEDITLKKELEREKDDFIGIASHELRTPVTSIKAFLQILQRKAASVPDQFFHDSLKRSLELAEKLSILITSLLDISKLRSGKLTLKITEFDMQQLVFETIKHTEVISKTHRILFEHKGAFQVRADRVWAEQVLSNLITNAIKFSPGADRISIGLAQDETASRAVVSVKDYGLGIPVHEQDKIFKRFSRTTKVMEKQIPGIGLGLHLCFEIIKLQEGDMWFESIENEGSVFYFSLPLA